MKEYMQRKIELINRELDGIYAENIALNATLAKSMNYSLMAGGKRLRPILVMAAADAVGADGEKFLHLATSIEMIHTYSLIHDDLPAMDNDDYRRGKLTNHKVFGDGIAVLAGDALLTMAFEVIADSPNVDTEKKLKVIKEMSHAAGAEGMVGGQVIDLESEGKKIDMDTLRKMHSAKTGALFCAAIRSGAILGGATDKQLADLTQYARQFGLAFQITDDILDVTGDEASIGKPVGSDEKNHKSTYVTLGSLESARELAQTAVDEAKKALADFGKEADFLRELVDYLISRKK
ncbi:MAG TPA: polyprenyl synthetase family protein [Megamonas hypermegale]|uniref:Farnesyl diphosphate synthase n=1 Tax=Megamonas hypermegale TaxID=158847 RepID=A0A921L7V2_9FIRM|nr:polyprenyl synthetase family protein [Megamonas hypermegale]